MDQAFPTFTTNQLRFRQFEPKDVFDVYKLFSDPETMRFDGGRTMLNINEAFQFISVYSAYYPEGSYIRWAVENQKTGQFLGTGGFHKISKEANRGEIGGELLKSVWGNGLGKEALYGLTNFAFEELKFNRISALISPKNIGAQKVVETMGFRKEGVLQDWEFWNGQYTDMQMHALLKKEWREKHGKL